MIRSCVAIALSLVASCIPSTASFAQDKQIPRVAWVLIGSQLNEQAWKAFQAGMAEAGFQDGRNVKIEMKFLSGRPELYAQAFAELSQTPVAIFMAAGLQGINAARQAANGKPVLAYFCGNDVKQMVSTFARPGGNITGIACLSDEVALKRAELLIDAFPDRRRIGFMYNPEVPAKEQERADVEQTVIRLGRSMIPAPITKADQIDPTIATLVQQGADALVVAEDLFTFANMQSIAAAASRHRMPSIFAYRDFTAAGGTLSYGPSFLERSHKYGQYLGRLLAGTAPADLPIDQPIRFELVLNAGSARTIGVTVAPSILARVDEVID